MKIVKFFCSKVVPVLVLTVAIFFGWIFQAECPEGRFSATMVPLLNGKLPPIIFGHGKMEGTPVVPSDMKPQSRPENEILIPLQKSNYSMPALGIGMCCRPTIYDDELAKRTVLWFLLLGGRLIDGAQLHLNHKAIGQGVREAIQRGVPREEIFVTTKIFPSHFGYNKTKETVQTFLDELGLDYIDLVLMHFPSRMGPLAPGGCGEDGKACRQETFRALSELREQGIMRNIGVSNFGVHHLKDIEEMSGEVAPIAVNQIQYNPWSPQAWVDTFAYCREHNIAVTAYNSLGGVFLHAEAHTQMTLIKIAQYHEKTIADIMLRWALQIGAAVIPGTGNPKHMKESLAVYSFELSDEEIDAIDALRADESAKEFFSMEPVE